MTLVTTYLTDSDEAQMLAKGIQGELSHHSDLHGKVTVSPRGHVKVYTDSKRNIVKMRKVLESIEAALGI